MVSISKGKKVWWSCDQFTVGNFSKFSALVDQTVVISPFHADYFSRVYHINNATIIDLPVRVNDFIGRNVEREYNRILFSSIPDRGLHILQPIWLEVKRQIKGVSLIITSDYRLWGGSQNNERHRIHWMPERDSVQFLGAVKRPRLIEEELKADLLVYPCVYDELFCVSCAEAEVAGAYSITSDKGALSTTNLGTLIVGDPQRNINSYVEEIVLLLNNRELLENLRGELQKQAIERFSPNRIINEWDTKVFYNV